MQTILKQCNLITTLGISDDILKSIICDYSGLANCDAINTAGNIIIDQSSDDKISYAKIIGFNGLWRDTIVLNERFAAADNTGGNNNKLLYRFIFKWFGNQSKQRINEFSIGLISEEFMNVSSLLNRN